MITLQVEARVQGYTKAAFPVAAFREALAAALGVPPDAVAVLSVENLPTRREVGGGVRVASVATFPAGHSANAAEAAARLAPESLTRKLREGGMPAASVVALVATVSDPAALSTTPASTTPATATTPAIATSGTGPRPDAAVIGEPPHRMLTPRDRLVGVTWDEVRLSEMAQATHSRGWYFSC